MLIADLNEFGGGRMAAIAKNSGPTSPLAEFLAYFGKFLISTYNPKAILVLSAHWESNGEVEVMSYEKNHLYNDFYGFPQEMYNKNNFQSFGSPAVAARVVEVLKHSKIPVKAITKGRGLDHGVSIPFIKMFPSPSPFDIPVVEMSMNTLNPQQLMNLGKALAPLRDEGILILSGGLTIHTFQDWNAYDPDTCKQGYKDLQKAIIDSIEQTQNAEERTKALLALVKHPFFTIAHPREEHFVPLYVAAGAGLDEGAQIVSGHHGHISIAFGL